MFCAFFFSGRRPARLTGHTCSFTICLSLWSVWTVFHINAYSPDYHRGAAHQQTLMNGKACFFSRPLTGCICCHPMSMDNIAILSMLWANLRCWLIFRGEPTCRDRGIPIRWPTILPTLPFQWRHRRTSPTYSSVQGLATCIRPDQTHWIHNWSRKTRVNSLTRAEVITPE